jgi:hypothetical protein
VRFAYAGRLDAPTRRRLITILHRE